MKKLKQLLVAGFIGLLSVTVSAEDVTLYTGFQKGTYSVVGEDIKKVCGPRLRISTEMGGSLLNLNSLINDPVTKGGHRLGLVQKDVFDIVVKPLKNPPVKIVAPLFPEEILVLVNKTKGIRTLNDLNGRKVAGGPAGSGMWFTSNAIENLLGIRWLNIERTPEESILLLLTGEIDAMVVVGSHPMRLFDELPTSFSQYVDIININAYPKIDAIYRHDVTIPANTYIWQRQPISTKSTLTYLIAADDVPPAIVKEIQTCLTKNLPALKKLGHPKWKTGLIK